MGETRSGANITFSGCTRTVPLCVGHLVKHKSDAGKGGCTDVLPIMPQGLLDRAIRSYRAKTRVMGSEPVYLDHVKPKKKKLRNGSPGRLVYCTVSSAQTQD